MLPKRRKPTATSGFGVSRREGHDASGFYSRFALPKISADANVTPADRVDQIFHRDARHMPEVNDSSVALVVTSPPYFAGKEYEQALGEGHVPATYLDYLAMLRDVFAECFNKLEPGGRIAVNVANLGRKPYRSLAADVIGILQDELGLLLRGEVVWQKAQGAGGSCAWGSYQSPANPVLRDVTERVVIASKGRFDRALSRKERFARQLPSEASISEDEFLEATIDLWDIQPESATRVGHPAPFPVELPQRLIELYTYVNDLVLDPFMGSGSTGIAAARTDRHFVGYDTDAAYVEEARRRIAREGGRSEDRGRIELSVAPGEPEEHMLRRDIAIRTGQRAKEIALALLEDSGFKEIVQRPKLGRGINVDFAAVDQRGGKWLFEVIGSFSTNSRRAGLRRSETLWKALGRATVLMDTGRREYRFVFLATEMPPRRSANEVALKSARGRTFHDVIPLLSESGAARLEQYAVGEGYQIPIGEMLT